MKKISKYFFMCLMIVITIGMMTSCGSKVDKAALDKKVEQSLNSDQEPQFTDDEYQFMADYLFDNFDYLYKLDIDNPDLESGVSYMMIMALADAQGKLSKEAQKKYDRFKEKLNNTDEFINYKANEKNIMEELENSDIDWDEIFGDEEETEECIAIGEVEE